MTTRFQTRIVECEKKTGNTTKIEMKLSKKSAEKKTRICVCVCVFVSGKVVLTSSLTRFAS